MGVGANAGVPAGVLLLRVDLLPYLGAYMPPLKSPLSHGAESVSPKHVTPEALAMDRDALIERERLFLVYAKQWWREV